MTKTQTLDFASVGKNVRVFPYARIIYPEHIHVASHVMIDDLAFIGPQATLVIGNYVHISTNVSIVGGGECLISDFASVSIGATILTGTDETDGGGLINTTIPMEYRHVRRGRVILEPHCGLAVNSVVLPDVTIGEGTIVAPGTVVNKDLAPWSLYAGVPARRVKSRPKEKILADEQALFASHGRPAKLYRPGSPDLPPGFLADADGMTD